MKTAFLGLGIMGSRMAANIIKAGHEVYLYNRTKSSAEALAGTGGYVCNTPGEAVKNCEVVLTMLSTPDAVEEVSFGKEGFIKHLKKGSLWINTSTINPSFAEKMAYKANEAGIRYLDAPVAGSLIPAEKGELTFLIGGEQEDLTQVKDLLSAMGKNMPYFGKAGKGSAMKMVINLMLAQSMLAFSEAVSLGLTMGIDKSQLLNILTGGPAAAPFLTLKRPKVESGNFEAEFPLQWMHKDLHLVSQTAYEMGVAMPLTNVTKELYAMAEQQGLGKKDFSAVFELLYNEDNNNKGATAAG